MKRLVILGIVAMLIAGSASAQDSQQPATPDSSKTEKEALPLSERLPAKIHKIQENLDSWIQETGKKDKPTAQKAIALMQELKEQLGAKNFEEAEKTADAILKLMGTNAPTAAQEGANKPRQASPTSPPSNDTKKRLMEKVERVKAGAQKWAASGRDPSEIAKTMVEKFKPLMEAGKIAEAEAELDRVLEQLANGTSAPAAAETIPQDASSYEERLPPKIHRIQKELPAWIEKPGNKEKATAFMQKLKEHLDAMNFAEADKTADSILKMMGVSAPAGAEGDDNKLQPTPSSPPSNDPTKRLKAKVERIEEGARQWAASGRDPSTIAKAMEEKVKPLFDAGKPLEAEAELDRILEQLGDKEAEGAPAAAAAVPQDASSYEERLPPKIHRIQKELPAWIEKPGNKEKAVAFMQKLKEHLDAMNFAEADKTADAILKMIGENAPAAAQIGASAQAPIKEISEETLKKLRHEVGGPFIVSRDKVQEDLQLTTEQKERLQRRLGELVPDFVQLSQKIQGLKPEDRKTELKAYRPKAQAQLAATLKETLDEGQRARLRQLELQREGLRNAQIWKDLRVTDEQRTQFMAMMQQAQNETRSQMEELKNGGARKDEIQPKVIKIREDLERKMEALLTDPQRKQWQEMQGKPMDLADLFDL